MFGALCSEQASGIVPPTLRSRITFNYKDNLAVNPEMADALANFDLTGEGLSAARTVVLGQWLGALSLLCSSAV